MIQVDRPLRTSVIPKLISGRRLGTIQPAEEFNGITTGIFDKKRPNWIAYAVRKRLENSDVLVSCQSTVPRIRGHHTQHHRVFFCTLW
jgi:hypothetical protein